MVYYNRQWGTVCDDHFGSDEADTACRSMGYAGAVRHSNTRSERSYTGNFLYLEGFHFRWLKIKGIYAACPTSINIYR